MEIKHPLKSKTNWVGLATAVISFFPSAAEWVADHPQGFMQLIGFLILGLRFITKGKISIS